MSVARVARLGFECVRICMFIWYVHVFATETIAIVAAVFVVVVVGVVAGLLAPTQPERRDK